MSSPENISQPIEVPAQNQGREGLPRNRLVAIGATVAIAAGVGGIESIQPPEGTESAPAAEITVDMPVSSPEDVVAQINSEVKTAIRGDALNSYEQDFQTEQTDAEDSGNDVRNFVEQNKELLSHPEKIDRISIIGLASAEDEQLNDEQLLTPSVKNLELAGQRGELARTALVEEIKAQTGVDVADKITLGAREDMLNQEEYQQVTEMVGRFGYESVETMVNAYNRGGTVPPEVGELLDGVLASQRGAEITIELHDGTQLEIKAPKPVPQEDDGGEDAVVAPDRYEGYIPKDQAQAVISETPYPPERPGKQFARIKDGSRFQSRTDPVRERIIQPRSGNTNVRNKSMSKSKRSTGRKGGHGKHSSRGHHG